LSLRSLPGAAFKLCLGGGVYSSAARPKRPLLRRSSGSPLSVLSKMLCSSSPPLLALTPNPHLPPSLPLFLLCGSSASSASLRYVSFHFPPSLPAYLLTSLFLNPLPQLRLASFSSRSTAECTAAAPSSFFGIARRPLAVAP